jgi:hypothetical protein
MRARKRERKTSWTHADPHGFSCTGCKLHQFRNFVGGVVKVDHQSLVGDVNNFNQHPRFGMGLEIVGTPGPPRFYPFCDGGDHDSHFTQESVLGGTKIVLASYSSPPSTPHCCQPLSFLVLFLLCGENVLEV